MRRSLLLVALVLLLAASAAPSQAADFSRSVAACPSTPASAPAPALGQTVPLFMTAVQCGCSLPDGVCADGSDATDNCPGLFQGSPCTISCGAIHSSGLCFGVYTGGRPTRCPSGTGYLCACIDAS